MVSRKPVASSEQGRVAPARQGRGRGRSRASRGPVRPREGGDEVTATREPVDRAKVVDIARPRRRRRWRRVGWVSLSAVLAGLLAQGGNALLHSSYFRVSSVQVLGATHESAAQVIAASGLNSHPAMMDVSSSAIANRLRQFTWIDHVSVVTHWPHRVVITVVESHAVAVTFIGPHLDFVGDLGQNLGPAPLGENLPTLVGPGGLNGERAWIFRGSPAALVAAQLPPAFASQVREIHQSTSGAVSLVMTTPLTFVLGSTTDLNAKFVAVASAIAHATFAPGDVVDVSTPSEIAVSGPSSSSSG